MKQNYQKEAVTIGVVALLLLVVGVSLSLAAGQYNPYGGYQSFPQPPDPRLDFDNRILQHVLSAFLGGLIGAFFSKPLAMVRKWLLLLFVLVGAVVGAAAHVVLGNIAFFFLGALAVYLLLNALIPAPRRKKPTTFGSAEWADLDHLSQNKLIGDTGFFLGFFATGETTHPLHYTGDRHLLTVAPTRSGKGVSAIIPNLLTYEGSAIVIDPKGENAMITAARRGMGDEEKNIQGMGQSVHIVDPWGITGKPSARFNPLDWLDPEDPDMNENAMILADSIITPHAGNRDQFWDEEAKALLMGILLWVALDEKEQEDRTLGRVRDIISLGGEELNDLLTEMKLSENHIICSAGTRTLSKEDKLKSSVLASLQSHTHFLDSPRLRENLAVSDFSFADLKTSPTTIYLVLPADRLDTFGRWLRLMIQQALTVNARNIDVKPEKPILFLLDEMAALGRLSMVEQAYSLMAGFGVQLWGIVQDLSQLHRIYGDSWQTFIGNSGVLQYFGSRDLMTAEYFSKLCGVTTVEKRSFGFSWTRGYSSNSGQPNSGTSSESTTENSSIDVVQRNLVYPDELMVLRDNKEIVLIETANPIPARRMLWFKDQKLKSLGINLHPEKEEYLPPVAPEETKTERLQSYISASDRPEAASFSDKIKLDSLFQKGSDFIKNLKDK